MAPRVTVIGDATWDVTALTETRPTPGGDQHARIHAGPGGQGGNVAVRLARRGALVRLVTAIGPDAEGALIEAALIGEGIAVVNIGAPRSGTVVALVDASGERAMLSDRASLDLAQVGHLSAARALADADWIHLSGYPLADPASAAGLATLAAGRTSSQRCSVGGGSFAPGLPIGATLRSARPDLVLFDRRESAVVLASPAAADAPGADILASALATALDAAAVVTDGAAGAAVATVNGTARVSGPAVPVVDATGAGDALAAAVILALVDEPWPPSVDELRQAVAGGARAGAEVAGVVGAQARIAVEGVA